MIFARASPLLARMPKHFAQSEFLIHLKQQIFMDNKPTHYLYNVIDQADGMGEGTRGIWTKIGAAWPNGDGKGFSISLDIPLVVSRDTRLVLREREELPTMRQSETDEAEEADAVDEAMEEVLSDDAPGLMGNRDQ